jgi:hypothetical protein
VGGDVVRRQHPLPRPGRSDRRDVTSRGADGGDNEVAVAADRGDGPGVTVGDTEVTVVAAGGDPVAGADPLSRSGRRCAAVVDAAIGDEMLPDGGVELGGLFAGVDHHRHRLIPVGRGGGDCGNRVLQRSRIGMEADLAAGGQGVEHGAGVLGALAP